MHYRLDGKTPSAMEDASMDEQERFTLAEVREKERAAFLKCAEVGREAYQSGYYFDVEEEVAIHYPSVIDNPSEPVAT